jgi:hypothetical protein
MANGGLYSLPVVDALGGTLMALLARSKYNPFVWHKDI